jgi:transposase-like protein
MRRRKQGDYPRESKLSVVERLERGEPASVLAQELKVPRKRLYVWWAAYRAQGAAGLRPTGRPSKLALSGSGAGAGPPSDPLTRAERRVAELERKVGQQQLELDFFKRALRQVEALGQPESGRGATASTPSSKR